MREVRIEKDGEAPVALRHGKVRGRVRVLIGDIRFGLRGLLVVILFGMQIAGDDIAKGRKISRKARRERKENR